MHSMVELIQAATSLTRASLVIPTQVRILIHHLIRYTLHMYLTFVFIIGYNYIIHNCHLCYIIAT
jgi:hypothetical protein